MTGAATRETVIPAVYGILDQRAASGRVARVRKGFPVNTLANGWNLGGFHYGYYDGPIKNARDLTDITWEVRVDESHGTADGWYVAMQCPTAPAPGSGARGYGAYAGIQTNTVIGDGEFGHGAIFSVWDVSGGGDAGPGATVQPFGGEGVGQSVRAPYDWIDGRTYRLRVHRSETTRRPIQFWRVDRLWRFEITDTVTSVTTYIGGLWIPDVITRFSGEFISFVERYSEMTSPGNPACADKRPFGVTIQNLVGNPSSTAVRPTDVDHGTFKVIVECQEESWWKDIDDTGGYACGVRTPVPADGLAFFGVIGPVDGYTRYGYIGSWSQKDERVTITLPVPPGDGGEHTLRFRYRNAEAGASERAWSVNDVTQASTLSFVRNAGTWDDASWSDHEVRGVRLTEGVNTLRMWVPSTGGNGLDLDLVGYRKDSESDRVTTALASSRS
jgi:hypothetical protein